MPSAWCKEDLSVAYAKATGTAIGVACDQLQRDINGWDVLFRGRDTDTESAAQLAVQLKCTVSRLRRVDDGRALSFQLDAGDYNNLRRSPTFPPRMLVVVEVPHPDQNRWVKHQSDRLLLFASAWYVSLEGAPALPPAQQTTAVRIPVGQRFDPSALRANMRSCP